MSTNACPELSGVNVVYEKLCGASVKPSSWVLYLWLSSQQRVENNYVETTLATIRNGSPGVRPCNLSTNTIYSSLEELQESGLIRVETEGLTRASVMKIEIR